MGYYYGGGAAQQHADVEAAAQSLPAKPTQAQIEEAAGKFGADVGRVAARRGQITSKPERTQTKIGAAFAAAEPIRQAERAAAQEVTRLEAIQRTGQLTEAAKQKLESLKPKEVVQPTTQAESQKVTQAEFERIKAQESREKQKALLERMGKTAEFRDTGELIAREEGRKITITPGGLVVETPEAAIVSSPFVAPAARKVIETKAKQEAKLAEARAGVEFRAGYFKTPVVSIKTAIKTGEIKTLSQLKGAISEVELPLYESRQLEAEFIIPLRERTGVGGLKGATESLKALFYDPKSFQAIQKSKSLERRAAGKKGLDFQYLAQLPATQWREVGATVAVGGVFGAVSNIPKVGAILKSKWVGGTLLGAYATTKGIETAYKYKTDQFYRTPTGIAELAISPALEVGSFIAGGQILKAGALGLAKKTATPQRSRLITIQTTKATPPKYVKQLTKFKVKLEPSEAEALKRYATEAGVPEKSIVIDIAKLKPKQLTALKAAIDTGKVKSSFEFEISPTAAQLGIQYGSRPIVKTIQKVSEATKAFQLKVSERYFTGVGKAIKGTKEAQQRSYFRTQETEIALEKEIKLKMKQTGKTAQEIYTDIQARGKVYDQPRSFIKPEPKGKKKGKKPETDPLQESFERFKPQQEGALAQLSQRLGRGQRQQLVFAEQTYQPYEIIKFPSAKSIRLAGALMQIPTKAIYGLGLLSLMPGKTKVAQLTYQAQLTRQEQRLSTSQLTVQSQTLIQGQSQQQQQRQEQLQRQRQQQEQRQEQQQRQEQRQQQQQRQEQIQQQVQEQVQRQEQITKLKVPKLIVPGIPDLTPTKIGTGLAAGLKVPGYHVYIKRKQLKKGKGSYQSRGYEKANDVPLTESGATVMGGEITDRYANRSYQIRKAGQNAKAKYKDYLLETIKQKFRQSKKNPNVFVEKTAFAIDSPEEKQGIPYEAARLRKAGLLDLKKKKQQLTSLIFVKQKVKKQQQLMNLISTKRAGNFLSSNKTGGKKSQWL